MIIKIPKNITCIIIDELIVDSLPCAALLIINNEDIVYKIKKDVPGYLLILNIFVFNYQILQF